MRKRKRIKTASRCTNTAGKNPVFMVPHSTDTSNATTDTVDMKPTSHLRQVNRVDRGTVWTTLQQWWSADDENPADCKGMFGEWRDIPLVPETRDAPQ